MVKVFLAFLTIVFVALNSVKAQKLDKELASELAQLPFTCIDQEFPNKTSHVQHGVLDAKLFPSELHPAFYGCYDWHSSVHGHWSLIRLLRLFPELEGRDSILYKLSKSFTKEALLEEANYFKKYELSKTFERTYGWAWLLLLDRELALWQEDRAAEWRANLTPLVAVIVESWEAYLPKETYPNRTGVHPNTAFGLCFAIDWARTVGNDSLEHKFIEKAKSHFLKDERIPAYLEPNGTDFFSPSLQVADLMTRILDKKAYQQWFKRYYDNKSFAKVLQLPIISDRNDYHISHLDGLVMSRAWNMKRIIPMLDMRNPRRRQLMKTSQLFLKEALQNLHKGNYGGAHWLGSFAVYALSE